MSEIDNKINEAVVSLAYLKDKAFIECVNDLIKKDVLVFYDQTPYTEGRLLTDSTINIKGGCLLTTTNRINTLEIRNDSQSLTIRQQEKDLKQSREEIEVLKAKLEKCKRQRKHFIIKFWQHQDDMTLYEENKAIEGDISMLDYELNAITIDSIKRGE